MTMIFEPSGRGASRAFRVENEADDPVAVQITIFRRSITVDGREENTPSEGEFAVYPSQMILKARQVQTIRVKWVGPAKSKKELAYRILAEQLPVNLSKEEQTGAKINFVVRYLGSIYVVPKGAKPLVVLDSIQPVPTAEGENMTLDFRNDGDAHAILRDFRITLRANGKSVELKANRLSGINGENILAQSRRRFLLPWPSELPKGTVEADFDFHHR